MSVAMGWFLFAVFFILFFFIYTVFSIFFRFRLSLSLPQLSNSLPTFFASETAIFFFYVL